MKTGCFISLEGGEGSGKTTQITLLKDRLLALGKEVVITREPGGSSGAEEIRNLLLKGDPNRWLPMTELLLLYAARFDHVERLIKPALSAGQWVISDRFADSSMAYQGYGHDLGAQTVATVHKATLGDFKPNLTLILDIDTDEGLKRAGVRMNDKTNPEDRFERMGKSFHEKQRRGFLTIAKENPERCVVIDANGSAPHVAELIWRHVQDRLAIGLNN